jgi:hypothetical protein
MLWGQQIKVYTDHKNLIRDVLGLTSDIVCRWRLLLEEYAPKIVYIKGIHNTVADATSQLEYNPEVNPTNEQILPTLGYPPRAIVGKALQHCGVLIMRRTQACMDKTAT